MIRQRTFFKETRPCRLLGAPPLTGVEEVVLHEVPLEVLGVRAVRVEVLHELEGGRLRLAAVPAADVPLALFTFF